MVKIKWCEMLALFSGKHFVVQFSFRMTYFFYLELADNVPELFPVEHNSDHFL